MASIGVDRRTAQQLDRRYGFGNQDLDFTTFCNFDPLPAVGAAVAGSSSQYSITGTGTPVLALLNPNNTRPGGLLLTTRVATANGDEARLSPYANSQFSQQLRPTLGERTIFDATVRVTQNTLIQLWAGLKLTDTGVVATDADQAMFLFDTSVTPNFGPAGVGNLAVSANWYAVVSVGGNDFALDTLVPVTLNKDYRLKILIKSDGVPQFYINNGVPKVVPGAGVMTAAAALQCRLGLTTRDATPLQANAGFRGVRFQRQVPN